MPYLFFFWTVYHSDEIPACWWEFQYLLLLTRPVASHRSTLLVPPLKHTTVFAKQIILGIFLPGHYRLLLMQLSSCCSALALNNIKLAVFVVFVACHITAWPFYANK